MRRCVQAVLLAGFLSGASSLFAAGGNALDRLDFGHVTSEALHQCVPGAASMGVGISNQTYRLPAVGSGITFTMACDPLRQNYLTLRLWGNDANSLITGSGLFGASTFEREIGPTAIFPNRFYYSTLPIDIGLTSNRTLVTLTVTEDSVSKRLYSTFTHTAPMFVPDAGDPRGSAPPRNSSVVLTPLTTSEVFNAMMVSRSNLFAGSGCLLSNLIARQITPATTGAPPECVGLDLWTTVSTFGGTNQAPDAWRNRIANSKTGAGYTGFSDPMILTLTTAYLLPPFTNANGAVVAGLDRQYDTNLLQRIVWFLDGATYMQGAPGGFPQQGQDWCGLCSTPRTIAGDFPVGTTDRQGIIHGGGDLQGAGVFALGWAVTLLMNDPVSRAAFTNHLAGSFDADFSGTPMLRAYAYERMLFQGVNWFAYATGGTESQNLFQMVAGYACWAALQKLQALYPNPSYIPGPSTYAATTYFQSSDPSDLARMVMGVIPDTFRGIGWPSFTNSVCYGITKKGMGEAGGSMSCGFDGGGYGSFLPDFGERIAQLAAWDDSMSATGRAAIAAQARAAVDGFDQFFYAQDNAAVDANRVLTTNVYGFNCEKYITSRDTKNPQEGAGSFDFDVRYFAADPDGPITNAMALRSVYLDLKYRGALPLSYCYVLPSSERTLRRLLNADPATLRPLPGEPGQPDYAWVDEQCGAIAVRNRGDQIFANLNWRNTKPDVSQITRIHFTQADIEREATIIQPKNASTMQTDGNLTGTNYFTPFVARYGDYLFVVNNTTALTYNAKLPAGIGQAQDLISRTNFYDLGTTIPVLPGKAAIFWLAASNDFKGLAGAPTIAAPAEASPAAVTGTTASLSVLGSDDGGEPSLKYTWALSGNAPGAATFSANTNNAAKNTTVSFSAAGTYVLAVTVLDTNGLATGSMVTVEVSQAISGIAISPTSALVFNGQSQAFFANVTDQFGLAMKSAPTVSWSLAGGTGSVDVVGTYTAPTNSGVTAYVKASIGTRSATGTVVVPPPTGQFQAAVDIGSPGVPGSTTYNAGTGAYTVRGSGYDVWFATDQFHFAASAIAGDFTLTARLLTFTNATGGTPPSNAKAGVMIRNSLAPSSAWVGDYQAPNSTVRFEYRTTAGGSCAGTTVAGLGLPRWVRLNRTGNVFAGYQSADGTNWTQVGTAQTISMGDTIFAGLYVCSYNNGALAVATFDNVLIERPVFSLPAFNSMGTGAGSYAESTGTVTLAGTGGDIWSTADNIIFAHAPVYGDATVSARIVSISPNNVACKAGVMMRESVAAGSAEACAIVSPNQNLRWERRAATGGATVENVYSPYATPYWLRMVRVGNNFSGFQSVDGTNWVQVGATAAITMKNTIRMGLAMGPNNTAAASTSVFDNVVISGASNTAPTVATPAAAGAVSNNACTVSVLGADATGGEGNLIYTWELLGIPPAPVSLSTNGVNAARTVVASFSASGVYYFRVTITDQGGLSVPSALVSVGVGALVPLGLMAVAGNGSATLSWLPTPSATNYIVKRATAGGGPYENRTRSTNTTYVDSGVTNGVTYYYVVSALSAAGESMNSAEVHATPSALPGVPVNVLAFPGNASVSLSWSPRADALGFLVRRATSSGGPYLDRTNTANTSCLDTGLTNGATYFYVVAAVNEFGVGGNSAEVSAIPTSSALPPPWRHQDVGAVGFTGAATYEAGVFTLTASGADIWGTADEFHFVHQPAAGNFDLRVRVTAMTNTDAWVKCGVMARESLDPASKQVDVVIAPTTANGIVMQYRAATGGASVQVAQQTGSSASVPRYLRLARSGNVFTGYRSANGTSWTQMSAVTNAFSNTVYVGLALASHDNTETTFASISSVTMTSALPPVVSNVLAQAGDAQVLLSWSAAARATNYVVRRATAMDGSFEETTNTAGTSCLDAGVANDITYFYVVSAQDAAGEGGASAPVSATPFNSAPTLLAWLRFDETNGATAADSVGWRNGSLVNGPAWAGGLIDNAVELDGVDDYIGLPSGAVSNIGNCTIAAWVRLDSAGAWSRVFDFGAGTTNYMFLSPRSGASNTVRFAITTSGNAGEKRIDGALPLATGTWTHVAVSLLGSIGILYVDGVEVGRNEALSLKPSNLGNTTQNWIGRSQYADPYLDGRVDDFRIYGGALNAASVYELAHPPLPPVGPSDLSATPLSESQLRLAWVDNSSDETKFVVDRTLTGSDVWVTVANSLPPNTTSGTDSGLSPSASYDFRVHAENEYGSSRYAMLTDVIMPAGVGDGIPGWWRLLHFGDGLSTDAWSCATCDPDGDRTSNFDEYQAGTNPTNVASVFEAWATNAPAGFSVQWSSVPGKVYGVWWAPSPASGWTLGATVTGQAAASHASFSEGTSRTDARVYRVQLR